MRIPVLFGHWRARGARHIVVTILLRDAILRNFLAQMDARAAFGRLIALFWHLAKMSFWRSSKRKPRGHMAILATSLHFFMCTKPHIFAVENPISALKVPQPNRQGKLRQRAIPYVIPPLRFIYHVFDQRPREQFTIFPATPDADFGQVTLNGLVNLAKEIDGIFDPVD